MSRLTKWVGASAAAGLSAFTVFSGTAAGFFPPLPLGNDPPTVAPQVPVVPQTVPPTTPQPIVTVPPPPFVPVVPKTVDPTPKSPPPVVCDCDPKPVHCVPEPTTVVTGLVGVSLLAVGAIRRKLRGGNTPQG